MAFSQLGYQYIRPLYPPSERPGSGGGTPGTTTTASSVRSGASELSPSGALSSVLSSMYGAPYAAAAAAQGYGAFLPYAATELPIFPQLGAQYELKDSPGVQHPAFPHHHPAFYPYGQYQFGDPSRPKNATRESTSTLKAWLNEHRKNPYPTKGEKIMLAIITKMTLTQVSTWFANARRRLKKENKMTWAPRSRTDDEEGNAYGSDRDDDEADKPDRDDEEEIDLENIDAENMVESALGGAGTKDSSLLLEGEDEEEEEEEEEEEDPTEEEEEVAARLLLPPDAAKSTDSEASSDGTGAAFEDLHAASRERFLKAVEEARQLHKAAPERLPSPQPPSPSTAPPSPALPPPPPPPPPPKPKIWSLAETATSPDNPTSRKSPPGGGSGGGSPTAAASSSSSASPLVAAAAAASSPAAGPAAVAAAVAAAAAHRLASSTCPLGKFAAAWPGRPFSAHHPHHHHHHHHHHPHPLTLLNTPHLLGLAGGNPSGGPVGGGPGGGAAAIAALSRPADQAQSAEASAGGTDPSSVLEVEKKLIKTAFQPVQRRPQNQLDAAMVLSALSSS